MSENMMMNALGRTSSIYTFFYHIMHDNMSLCLIVLRVYVSCVIINSGVLCEVTAELNLTIHVFDILCTLLLGFRHSVIRFLLYISVIVT